LRRRRLRDQLARHAPPAAFAAMAHGELADPGSGGDAVLQLLSADLGCPRTRRGPTRRAPGPDVLHDRNGGGRVAVSQTHRHDPVCRPCAGVSGRGLRTRDALAGEAMSITPDQRTYARFAGIMILAHVVLEGIGDSVTIIARSGESF